MPPSYHLQAFWDDRFAKESSFEWLGDGRTTLLPHLRTHLLSEIQHFALPHPPRLLHIGAGSSKLSEDAYDIYQDVYGGEVDKGMIMNVDFSETAVQQGLEKELGVVPNGSGGSARWVQADLLKWEEVRPLVEDTQDEAAGDHFGAIIDKSTSDALACGESVPFDATSSHSSHPAIQHYLAQHPSAELRMDPVELLALHLASVTRPGGLWLALSFSSGRFACLHDGRRDADDALSARRYWTLEEVLMADAPSGQSSGGVGVPLIYHYIYLVRRTNVRVE